MAARKKVAAKKQAAPERGNTIITNCSFVGNPPPVNEDTRMAVVALANACAKNAEALLETAKALKGAPGFETGIRLENRL